MKRILIFLIIFITVLPLWSAEIGLFTYEGGFFAKSGNTWKEYRPKDKPGVWATYTQYNEETNYYNIKNDNSTLAIPKTSNNNFYKSKRRMESRLQYSCNLSKFCRFICQAILFQEWFLRS